MIAIRYESSLKNALKIFNLALLLQTSLVWSEDFLRPYPNEIFLNETVQFMPAKGFHFEMKAPQVCDSSPPVEKTAAKVSCRFNDAGPKKVILSVCDDSKTFCRPIDLTITAKGQNNLQARPKSADAKLKTVQAEIRKLNAPGFQILSVEEYRGLNQKRPVLMLVSTDWCPTCNEMKESLLATDAFQDETKSLLKIDVDGDSTTSNEWQKIAPFRFYPTFILLDKDLNEVARYVGSPRLQTFIEWRKTALKNLYEPIKEVRIRHEERKNRAFKRRVIDWLFPDRKEMDEARLLEWALLALDDQTINDFKENDVPENLRPIWYRFQLARSIERTDTEKVQLFSKLIESEPGAPEYTEDLEGFCELDAKACSQYLLPLPGRREWWFKQKFSSESEKWTALADEASNQAQIYKILKDPDNLAIQAKLCLDAASEGIKYSPLKVSRAMNISRSFCFEEAGQVAEAEAAHKALIAAYDDEPTFHNRYAKFLKRQKKFKEALEQADLALQKSYGYMWLTVMALRIDLQIELKKKEEALKDVELALNHLDFSDGSSKLEQRWAARLRELEQKIKSL